MIKPTSEVCMTRSLHDYTQYFDIVNFPFLDGDVPRRPSYGAYISQLIRFARVCSHVDDFDTRHKCLMLNFHCFSITFLKQGYRYH